MPMAAPSPVPSPPLSYLSVRFMGPTGGSCLHQVAERDRSAGPAGKDKEVSTALVQVAMSPLPSAGMHSLRQRP